MNITPLLLKTFTVLALTTATMAAQSQPDTHRATGHEAQPRATPVVRPHRDANQTVPLPGDGNLPEASSALPLLSAIGAGVLLGGLLSARRTRK